MHVSKLSSGFLCPALLLRAVVVLLLTVGLSVGLAAGNTQVTATLSDPSVAPGESTTLILSIQNGGGLTEIPNIKATGLRIEFRGQSFQTRIENFSATQSLELTYEVSGDAEGTYTIPATPVPTENGIFHTPPLQLVVQPSTQSRSNSATSLAEISVLKTSAYLGESIPTEIRLLVDSRIRWEPESRPNLEGEGFTRLKMPNPTVEKIQRDGISYDVLIFRTVITPSKAGKLSVGPCEIRFRAESQQNRSRSPVDSLLGQFFAGTQVRSYSAKAPALELDVKTLPVEGRPSDFSGAVGVFQMQAVASPSKVKLGDPITLHTTISGRGNFDRVNAPELERAPGWNFYPPKSDFQAEEELAMSGRKIFEQALIAESPKTCLPELRFSFFNPETHAYETLKSGLTPISIEGVPGVAAATASPAPAPAGIDAATQPGPSPAQSVPLLSPKSEFGLPFAALAPPAWPRHFLWFQIPPALALALLWHSKSGRPSPAKLTRKRLIQELAQIQCRLQEETNRAAFYSAAVRAIQIHAALKAQLPDTAIDLQTLQAAFSTGLLESILPIFDTRNELLYAGTQRLASQNAVQEKEREIVLDKIHSFQTSLAK
jgi:hypothetical protein